MKKTNRVYPQNYVKASYTWEPEFQGRWTEEEKELWKSIDWQARNYEDYIVEDDTFDGEVVVYGLGDPVYLPTTFVKHIWANPIYAPCYDPVDEDFVRDEFPNDSIVGPMSDGNKHNGYLVHDRYETQELYNILST